MSAAKVSKSYSSKPQSPKAESSKPQPSKATSSKGGTTKGPAAPSGLTSNDFIHLLKKLPHNGVEQLIAALAKHGSPHPLGFVGDDTVRVRRLVRWVGEYLASENAAAGRGHSEVSIVTYSARDLGTSSILQSFAADIRGGSLFATDMLCVVTDADELKKDVVESIISLTQRLCEGDGKTLLVWTAAELKQSFVDLHSRSTIVKLSELVGDGLVRWIAREFGEEGAHISPDAAHLLIQLCGPRASDLLPEISKLALCVPRGGTVTAQIVGDVVFPRGEQSVFELLSSIARRNLQDATLRSVELMRRGSYPLQVCQFLAKCYRALAAMGALRGNEPAPRELGHPWFLKNLGKLNRFFPAKRLQAGLLECAALDVNLKGGSRAAPEELLHSAVVRLTLG